MQSLPIGKLRADTLQAIFDKHPSKDPRVVVGPRVGEDAAVIDMGDRYLVATSDPITFATAEIGWYALHVNANDIAVRGARPRWFLATVLLPAGATSDASLDALFAELHAACDELEVTLVGGHTDERRARGRRDRHDQGRAAGGRGDHRAGKGGRAPGARRLAGRHSSRPGVSQEPGAQHPAGGRNRVRADHRPRHARSDRGRNRHGAGVGLRIDRERIIVLPEGRALCAAFGLDPLGTIASGALLMTLAPADAGLVIHALARESIDCHFIGQVVPREQGVTLVSGSRQEPMPVFAQDEITRLYPGA